MVVANKFVHYFLVIFALSSCIIEPVDEAPTPLEKKESLLVSINDQSFEVFPCAAREKEVFTFSNKTKLFFTSAKSNKIIIKGDKKSLGDVQNYESAFYDGNIFHVISAPKPLKENNLLEVELTVDIDPFYKDKSGYIYVIFDRKFFLLFADVAITD